MFFVFSPKVWFGFYFCGLCLCVCVSGLFACGLFFFCFFWGGEGCVYGNEGELLINCIMTAINIHAM